MIKNLSRKTALSKDIRFCRSAMSKFLGLMFSKNHKATLVFEFAEEQFISLHMIFVFYPIYVIFLDKKKIVVDLKENFKPFTFYASKRKAIYVVELPKGAITKSKTKIGDRIRF